MPISTVNHSGDYVQPCSSIAPIQFWLTLVGSAPEPGVSFLINENIRVADPRLIQSYAKASATTFRAINCVIDSTNPTGSREIVYKNVYNQTSSYFVYYSGVHVLNGIGIISIGDGLLSTGFQVGV